MKKSLALLLVSALLLSAFGALAAESAPQTRVFVDSAGREVEVPVAIERIAPSGKMAHIALYALAADEFTCLSSAWTAGAEQFIPREILDLPVVGQFYGESALNLEALAAADPQVIIDIGEMKKSVATDMDDAQAQLGIPTVFIEMSLESAGEAYRMLGDLLGREEAAAAIAAYCDEIYQNTVNTMATVEDVARVCYCLGEDGLNVLGKGSYHAEALDLLCDNVAALESPSSKAFGDAVDFEQLYLWEPDVILFAPASAYEQAGGDAAWQELAAIARGNYYQVPAGPFNWMGFPPSVNRYLGLVWLSQLLYPEAFQYDLLAEAQRYFQLFYHYELTAEQFAQLTQGSLSAVPST